MPKIRPETLTDGSKRYRFTINIGRHPVTNARQQRTYTFTKMRDARAELGRLTGAVTNGTYTDRWDGTVNQLCDDCLASAAERLAAGAAYEASGYVAAAELGAPVNPEWLTDEFHRVAARAGLPRIRLHDGRHTINSLMAAAGIPDHIRAAWMGHAVAVNVGTYTHVRDGDLAQAAGALTGIFRAG